jgi:hypothetical protein
MSMCMNWAIVLSCWSGGTPVPVARVLRVRVTSIERATISLALNLSATLLNCERVD